MIKTSAHNSMTQPSYVSYIEPESGKQHIIPIPQNIGQVHVAKRSNRCKYALIGLAIVIVVVVVIVIAALITKNNKHTSTPIEDELPPLTYKNKTVDWNVVKYIYGTENIIVKDNFIQVRYPKGSFQNSGGFKFYAQPKMFPTSNACISYNIGIPDNFDFVKGGKLPGFWIGDMGANGGNSDDESSSCRVMWRENGMVEAYIYLPDKRQLSSYYKLVLPNHEYGDSLWRGEFGNLTKNAENSVRLCIKVNTFDKNTQKANYDGYIKLTINNTTRVFKEIVWTTNDAFKISGLFMNTFFGGNDESWGSSIDTYLRFSQFTISDYQ